MKLVYIILAHTNFEQTKRLFDRLNKGDVSFVIHISTTSSSEYFNEVYSALKDEPNCYFAERAVVRWGDFGVVQGALNAIDTIVEQKLDYDFVSLLSGQSYPIKSHEVICETLEQYRGKQLLEYIPFSEIQDEFLHRIEPHHFWIGNRHFRHPHQGSGNKLFANLIDFAISPFLPKRPPLPDGYVLFKGSFWWTLSKDCIEYIYEHVRTETGKNLIKFLKKTRHSGETYFQTVLMNSKYKDQVVNKDLRYILWKVALDEQGHPEVLTTQNFEGIASSECLFGRKFNLAVDAEIFDMIDEQLLSLDSGSA